ncbi:MAG: hypothetical protein H7Z73_11830 [Candidatus Saccharibacteria bacterium]|nr:hypothetical protein [Moraxellaceae bacterium]
MMRKLSDLEIRAMLLAANSVRDSAQREQLISDLQNSTVEEQSNGEIITFHIQGYSRPEYTGQHEFESVDGFPLEGKVADAAGNEVAVWLFADTNNRILEIELNNYTGDIPLPVTWDKFKLI